ncbi:hypothetical protein [Rhodoglobus aureus]|uniref:Uncharacterized protein n=1 Tax=Rhodoglobus aureus TaxID=191497 RepID=A0ABP4G204_9MICO
MRKLANLAPGIALVVAFGLMLGATPANAAGNVGVLEVSDDGVTFARSYPGVVFDNIARMSPGDSQSETIYVRNTGTVSGYLRISLRDVQYSDQHYGDALTVTTSTPSSTGNARAISSANPCQVTHEGTVVAPGEVVPVVATLALGNLNGSDGQGSTASLALRFSLSDSTPGTLPPTNCGNAGTTVPATPPGPGSPGSPVVTDSTGASGSTGSSDSSFGEEFVPVQNPDSSPSASTIPGEETSAGLLPALPSAFSLDPNTWRLYQEYLVLILFLAASIGAGISWLAGRRSRKEAADG